MRYLPFCILSLILLLSSCKGRVWYSDSDNVVWIHDTLVVNDTIVIRDTINSSLEGLFIYNLPCSIQYIHPEMPGKAIFVLWLHGGVRDQKAHNFLNDNNHIDKYRNFAYNKIANYLMNTGTKAIFIAPLCHKAEIPHCVSWRDCDQDITRIIQDYKNKGLIDEKRIYIAGCSDGAVGTWDYIEKHPDWFAAAMAFSCGGASLKKTTIPVYFSNTKNEGDLTGAIQRLNANGANIRYVHYPNLPHGWDEKEVTDDYLETFFSHHK